MTLPTTATTAAPGPSLRRAPAYAVGLLLRRVVVDPVRTGRLRTAGWPPGLAPVVALALLGFVGCLVLVATGPGLRERLDLVSRGTTTQPRATLDVMIALVVVTTALVLTGTLRGTLLVRLAGVALSLTVLLAAVRFASGGVLGGGFLTALVSWLGYLGFRVWRRRRPFAWWEFCVVLGLVTVVVVSPLALRIDEAATSQVEQRADLTANLLGTLATFAIVVTLLAAVAVSEVAFGFSLWSVEVIRTELPARALTTTLGLLAAIGVVATAVRLADGVVVRERALEGASALGLAAAIGLTWWGLDRVADRHHRGTTRIADLAGDVRRLALGVAVVLTTGAVLALVLAGLQQLVLLPLYATVPQPGVERLAAVLFALSQLVASHELAVAYGVAAVGCAVLAVRQARAGVRGSAEVVGIGAVLLTRSTLGQVGVAIPLSLDVLSALAVLGCLGLGLLWWRRGALDRVRQEALAVGLLLALAVTFRDLFGDPLGLVLGSAVGVAVFGLLWNFLTGADDANGDSPEFPRASRVLVTSGNLVLGGLLLATDALQRDSRQAGTLDGLLGAGNLLFGTPLVLAGLIAALVAGGRREPVVEAQSVGPGPDEMMSHGSTSTQRDR